MSKSFARLALALVAGSAATQICSANPSFGVAIGGTAEASATNVDPFAPGDLSHSQINSLGPVVLQQTSSQAATGALARANIQAINGTQVLEQPQASDADIAAIVQVGALHGTASSDASVSSSTDAVLTYAFSRLSITWFDTVTFHTADPLGSDFNLGLTLNDDVSTSFGADLRIRPDSFAFASALGRIFVMNVQSGGSPIPTLNVQDQVRQTVDGLFITSPPAHTVTATLHALDGQSFVIQGSMDLIANISTATGTAGASAMDTALFELSSSDPEASYSTASGTVFATMPEIIPGVPEPSKFALLLAGLGVMGVMGVMGRRRVVSRALQCPLQCAM